MTTREVLTAERDAALRLVASLSGDVAQVVAASEDSNADDEHDPEGATIAFERQQLSALLDQARRRVVDLDTALAQLDAGGYGTCERCGGDIGAERLEARPHTRTCIGCARATRG